MNVLEKILEEIEEKANKLRKSDNERKKCAYDNKDFERLVYFQDLIFATDRMENIVKDIIRSHMDEVENDGWIPVAERLPEIREIVKVTVHSSSWIGDYNSDWVPEEDKAHHTEEYHVHDGYLNENGVWMFYDDEYSENICEKKFGTDKGRIYDVVTAWQPLPEPYKGE